MKEIGSEFHISHWPSALITARDGDAEYVLSGRTALDIIIRDLKEQSNVLSVYMPAYCCESMIEPFLRNGIKVELYDMYLDAHGLHYDIDENKQVDILYVNNYFGYEDTLSIETIHNFKKRGTRIIYDRTHSMLMEDDNLQTLADYTFASIRKWMGVVTGAFLKMPTGFNHPILSDADYWQDKALAMMSKAKYLDGSLQVDKKSFLDAFGKFGHRLTQDYTAKRMDDLSYSIWMQSNLDAISQRRRRNAMALHDGLKGIRFITDWTDKVCPLFVSIFFESKEERDKVRKALTEANIFCPVHWPKNTLILEGMQANSLFDTELSLICDQRYDESDMERIITVVNNLI